MHLFFNSRKSIWIILFIALVIRVAYAVVSYSNNVMKDFNDDLLYKQLSDVMLVDGFFPCDLNKIGKGSAIVGPGIAWLNLPFLYIFSNSWLTLFILSCFVSMLITYLIYNITLEISNLKVAIAASLWSTIYPLFIKYIPTAGKDIWMTFLFSLIFYFSLKIRNQETHIYKYILALAILFALLVHLDERFLAYYPIVIIPFFLPNSNGFCYKESIKKFSLFSLIFIVLLTPWLIRNYYVYGKIMIISPRTTAITDKIFGYQNNTWVVLDPNVNYLSPSQIDSVQKGLINKLPFANVISDDQIGAMKKGNIPERFTYFDQMWNSVVQLWEPFDFYEGWSWNGFVFDGKWSLRHNLSVFLTSGLTLFFACFGMFHLFVRNRPYFWWFMIPIVYHTIIHALFIPYTNYRYRLPIDPLVLVIGIIGIFRICEKFLEYSKYSYLRDKYLDV